MKARDPSQPLFLLFGLFAAACTTSSSDPGGERPASGGAVAAAGGTSGSGGLAGGKAGEQGGTGEIWRGGSQAGGATALGGSAGSLSTGGAPAGGQPPAGGRNQAGAVASGGSAGGPAPSGGQAGSAGGATAGQSAGGANATGGVSTAGGAPSMGGRSISFGTLLDAGAVKSAAQELATSLADPGSASWRAKGDQRRTYRAQSGSDEPYRIVVPNAWDGTSQLPLVMFLHGAGSDENTYLDQNGKQLVTLAEQHGYLLVSPRGDEGAYGNFLRLSAPFGDEAGAAELMAAVTPATERANELSEQDVINVLELVLAEYPIDREALFLAGHSMGSGGTWYIGGKYASYFRALAPMSGPFVQKSGYPWDAVRPLSLFVTEGTQTPSLEASKLLAGWLDENGFTSEYLEVNADHGGMIPLVLPDIFDFFDQLRGH